MPMFKAPESVIADRLAASPKVAEAIGFRIYPVLAPVTAPLPFITWRRSGVQREMTLNGPAGWSAVTLTLELYAETYEAVRELADACRESLDGWGTGVENWVSVRNVSLQGESDGFVQLAGGDLPPVYSVTQTYNVLWGQE